MSGDPYAIARELLNVVTDEDRATWRASGPIDWVNESFAISINPEVGYCVRSERGCWYAVRNERLDRSEPGVSRAAFIEPESVAALEARVLFYPAAGRDWSEFLDLFADYIDEFRFVDIAYDFARDPGSPFANPSEFRKCTTMFEGDRTARMEERVTETGRTYRYLEPAWLTEVYERRRDGRQITVIRRRGFGQYALAELANHSIGVFVHRGDSPGEAGSNVYYLANKKADHEPCANLFDKLSRKLANEALIISDGSNAQARFLKKFHRTQISGEAAFSKMRGKSFCFGSFKWNCVGYVSGRYGPTLVWNIVAHEPWRSRGR